MLEKNPAIAPLHLCDFTINENVLHLSDEEQYENEQNIKFNIN